MFLTLFLSCSWVWRGVPIGYFVLLDEIYLLGGSAGRAADFAARQTSETAQNIQFMDRPTCALRVGVRSEVRL